MFRVVKFNISGKIINYILTMQDGFIHFYFTMLRLLLSLKDLTLQYVVSGIKFEASKGNQLKRSF